MRTNIGQPLKLILVHVLTLHEFKVSLYYDLQGLTQTDRNRPSQRQVARSWVSLDINLANDMNKYGSLI